MHERYLSPPGPSQAERQAIAARDLRKAKENLVRAAIKASETLRQATITFHESSAALSKFIDLEGATKEKDKAIAAVVAVMGDLD